MEVNLWRENVTCVVLPVVPKCWLYKVPSNSPPGCASLSTPMPLVTHLVDDKTPLIQYDNTWAPGTSADSYADQYYLGTFATTNVTGGAASWSFNGTAFWIYGSRRVNHGTYSVTVDGETYPNNNGQSNTFFFQQALFNMSGMTQGMHSVKIENTGTNSQFLDIDLVVWQSEVGNPGDQLVTQTVQDTDPDFQFQAPAWNTNPPQVNFFNNGTGHSTTAYNATVTYSFTGDSVALYGTVGPENGPYAVQLDGGEAMAFNGTQFMLYTQTMIYYADNLGPGSHQLMVTNLPEQSGQYLNIDYAEVASLASATNPNPALPTGSGSERNATGMASAVGTGGIAGIVVCVIAALIATIAAFFYYRKWQGAVRREQDIYQLYPPSSGSGKMTSRAGAQTMHDGISEALIASNGHSQHQPHGQIPMTVETQSISQSTHYSRMSPATEAQSSVISPIMSSEDEYIHRRALPATPSSPSGEAETSRRPLSLAKPGKLDLSDVVNSGLSPNSSSHGRVPRELPPPNYVQATSAI
ncbi:hypothetical protein BJ138DRAFT_1146014 [Hygrophoropsis aurantiaca]|uniref:Uncharacterized protein n=1 Tax=Hygrophoropsis aurantiaca TaxID=72124 RepID=A0ACB8AKC5_9AGAM|nr:hypothetical protein BJ138DRAFT_1146014 [Hygrophoropsis aurantiaca]